MEYKIVATSVLALESKEKSSSLKETNIFLDGAAENFGWLNPDGSHNESGVKPITIAFVQGLVANILSAQEAGWWDMQEHLEYIISELKRGTAQKNWEVVKADRP